MVTFDLFSALIDSRAGGSRLLDRIADRRRWQTDGTAVYDRWDALNKRAQKECRQWVPYRHLARDALGDAYRELGLAGDVDADLDELLASVGDWPLWPDVAEGLPRLGRRHQLGLLSNVDDEVFRRTRAAGYLDDARVMTSQRLRLYKPDPRIYHRARERLGSILHVATSARDVRGALEAGIPLVRLRRPGHELDPSGGRPEHEAGSIEELEHVLDRQQRHSEDRDA